MRVANQLFSKDKILDASSPLAHHFLPSIVYLNEIDASKLSLSSGDKAILFANETEVEATVDISNRCNPGAVIVPKVSDEQGLLKLAQRESVSWVEVKKC